MSPILCRYEYWASFWLFGLWSISHISSLDFPFGKLNWFNVNLQISLCSKFFMALNTMISDFLMDWFNMSIQMSLLFSFIFTEITSVLDIFMDWFIMSLQNSLCCSFIFTQITWIYSTFACTDSIWSFRCPCFTIMSKKKLQEH